MNDVRYSFGSDLRTVISSGKDNRTKLRKLFEKNLLLQTGICAVHSYFSEDVKTPYIFIYADTDKIPNIVEWEIIDGIYYPKGSVRRQIIDCFNDAVTEIALSKLNFPKDDSISAIFVEDYSRAAMNIYFNMNIVEIDKRVRKAFPNVGCHLRFCRTATSRHYYLIFNDRMSKEKADLDGTTEKITEFVISVCKQNDPLHIFCDNSAEPIVTTKSELIECGKAMEIICENTEFNTL